MAEEYEPTHSHARNNGLVFSQPEVRPLPTANADTRPSRAPIQYNHKQPSGQASGPQAQPHNSNPPAIPAQYAHSDEIKGQGYMDARHHEHPQPGFIRRD